MKRVFLIVLDSLGIGQMPDASSYNDFNCNTMKSISKSKFFNVKNMRKLGLFNIDGMEWADNKIESPIGSFARMSEISKGKDTIIGHWEIAGIKSEKPLDTFPEGFPEEIIKSFESAINKKVLCNKAYSGTEVIKDYGLEHVKTGNLIVYTSADSVFQIAAHEDVVSVSQLYEYCEIARKILNENYLVGRVIARPFIEKYPNYIRTSNRHDFSLAPPNVTMLDQLSSSNKDVIAIGKIKDIFAGRGITYSIKTSGNDEGIQQIFNWIDKDFEGLCFVNLVDFDMLYGHRNDIDGYARALSKFDDSVSEIIEKLKTDDILMITADHGCDPGDTSTDHTREYTPLLIYGKKIKPGMNLKTRNTFSDIGATILDYFNIEKKIQGSSMLNKVIT